MVRLIWWRSRKHRRVRNPLPDPLMWPSLIVVLDICLEETVELFFLQDQEMIQAFLPDASQKAFTDGIGSWRPVWRSKHFDTTCCCHSGKFGQEFAIIIPDQIFWGLPIRRGLPQLLRNPGIGGSGATPTSNSANRCTSSRHRVSYTRSSSSSLFYISSLILSLPRILFLEAFRIVTTL